MSMTFAGRYELEDLLLITAVETFPATDFSEKRRVFVHVFPADEHNLSAGDESARVVERFVEITTASASLVRAAGVDADTGYAYVVTDELPKEDVARWASEKRAVSAAASAGSGIAGAETVAPNAPGRPAVDPSLAVTAPSRIYIVPQPSAYPSRGPGSFTREFSSLLQAQKSVAQPAKPPIPPQAPAPPPPPVAFTRNLGGRAPIEEHTERPAEQPPLGTPARPEKSSSDTFTRMFGSAPAASKSAPADAPPPIADLKTPPTPPRETAGPGAFTRMFGSAQAPSQPAASDAAPPFAELKTPPANPARGTAAPGAFTSMFGTEPPAAQPAQAGAKEGAFTKLFGDLVADPASPPPSTQRVESPAPAIAPEPERPMERPAQLPRQPISPAKPESSTKFFRGEAAGAARAVPPAPRGPSEYTKVISVREAFGPNGVKPPSPAAPNAAVPAPPLAVPPAIPVPPTPSVAIPQPALPQAPPAQMQPPWPATPSVPWPAPPPVPQAPVPQVVPPPQAGPAKSWLPLILILNGLFVLAVLVILLFALTRH